MKRISVFFRFAFCVLCLFVFSISAAAINGDVNNDGNVSVLDSKAVLEFAAGTKTPTAEELLSADTNHDGYVTTDDAREILRAASAIITLPEHQYTEWVTVQKVTCTEEGIESSTCTTCNKEFHKITEPTGHKPENGVCVNCNKLLTNKYIEYNSKKLPFECTDTQMIELIGEPQDTINDKFFKRNADIYVYYTDYTDLVIFTFVDGALTQFVSYDSEARVVYEEKNFCVENVSDEATEYDNLTITGYFDRTGKIPEAYAIGVVFNKSYAYEVNKLNNSASEKIILHLTNGLRAINGLNVLEFCTVASDVARGHSKDMAENGYFDHVNLDGKTSADRMRDGGINWWICGENIAAGYIDPYIVIEDWYNSPGHRTNILEERFERLGVGVVYDYSSDYRVYLTQNFYSSF